MFAIFQVILLTFLVCLGTTASAAETKAYPERPIKLVIPYPPGGLSDLTARPLCDHAGSLLGQPVVIVNRAGGGGTVGFAEAIQAEADGYTLGWGSVGICTIQPQLTDLPFKTPDDYRTVINVISVPEIFAVRSDAPWQKMADLMGYVKGNPGKIRVAIPGIGSIQHLLFESFKDMTKLNMRTVPFAGGGKAIPAVLGGHTEAIVVAPAPLLGHIKAGKVRVLATFSDNRVPLFPDVPTFRELGYDIAKNEYVFVTLPKKATDNVVQTLYDAFGKAIKTDTFKKFSREKGLILEGEGGADLKKRLQSDYAFYGNLIRKLKLRQSK
jgi:tripartite-type tricarboxylate transporter receptor subunit TctC